MTSHEERVAQIVSQVKARPADKKITIRKASAAHQLHNRTWKEQCYRVDVSSLCNVLDFVPGKDRANKDTLLAICEGQVTMGQLAKAALPRGYVQQVIPEYPDFTVAGLINGEGIQSTAFKYGVFSHSVTEMEVVLGNGDVVTCSPTENSELFTLMIESYGTMGIVTRATVALTVCEFIKIFDPTVRSQRGDFLEGIVFAKDCYLIIESRFTNSDEGLPQFDPVPEDVDKGELYYYQYLRLKVLGNRKELVIHEDVIPTASFIFRSSRGLYWMLETRVGLEVLTNMAWFRRLCDKKVIEQMGVFGFESRGTLTPEQVQRCLVNQDMGIILPRLQEGIQFVQDKLGVYPLWICPVSTARGRKNCKEYLDIHPQQTKVIREDFVVDIGVYGEPTVRPFHHKKIVRELQNFVDCPSMWGVTYCNPGDIQGRWRPYREKYHAAGAFPGIEDKVTFRGSMEENMDEGPIFMWRFVEDYGWYWWIKVPLFLSILFYALFFVGGYMWRALKLISI